MGGARQTGKLQFDLDEQRRWSLSYHGDGLPVPLIRNATLGVWVGDTLVPLADLEDISVANRQPPGGESLAIRGRTPAPAGGVWIEAEFAAWEAGPGAQGSISVSVYPDRVLATIRGVRFFAAPESDVLPASGTLLALVNGYQSGSPCRIEPVGAADSVSHAALGLTREGRGLAVAFDAGEPGEAKVKLSAGGAEASLEAVSNWLPARPVRPEGDSSTMRLAYLPEGDGLAALGALATPASAVDRERFAGLAAPTGWCSWYELYGNVTEADVLANLDFCTAHFDSRFFRYIQLDDGYQRAAGDWDTNAKFPNGHRWLTDRIHARGLLAGLWIAPFAVAERSGLPAAHPDWLQKGPPPPAADGAPLLVDTREDWGGRVYALDGAHPEVQQWLYDVARRAVRDWGYDYLKVDFLHWATAGAAHYGGLTHAEAYRRGLSALRDGLGTEAYLLGSGAPLQHAAGVVDGMRIGPDVGASWGGVQGPARAAALRSFYQRAAWLNDPDCLVVRSPLTLDEARVWASVVAASGGATFFSDNLPKLPTDRIPLLQKTQPAAAAVGRPVGTQIDEHEVAPALVGGADVVRLRGPWRFRTGDDPRYAARDYDDETWETTPVPEAWEQAGHPDYDGLAWYRTRFTLPPAPPPAQGDGRTEGRKVMLELGKVDDGDETFVNGVKVGETSGWRAYRRYPVPASVLNWGGQNVLAIRVADSGGPGGFWSVRRDRPAPIWVVEGAPRWWTVVLVNWDDEPQTLSQSLAALGLSGARFTAYDVWAERPLAEVAQALKATLAPHTTLAVGLRPAASRPQVIGTTRHVIQGAIDIADEQWDTATRTLSAKAVRLDGRPYAVTVAVPRGLRAGVCKADVPCTVRRLPTGQAVMEWPQGNVKDIAWSLSFRAVTRR
ncbi:MAG TPA: alpha-galactosidase [Gemmatimonadales bacterium]|jgi:alpha-galactosidase|nr:alpha-galactosidase [Gemmatimonadales bacterium]